MYSLYRCMNLWHFKCWLRLFECIWLKYLTSMPTKIKTTLKLSHQSFKQLQLWSVTTPWPLVLPQQLTDSFYVGLDISTLKMLRICFYLKSKMSNWQNTARLLCEIVHILICSVQSCIRLQNRVLGK